MVWKKKKYSFANCNLRVTIRNWKETLDERLDSPQESLTIVEHDQLQATEDLSENTVDDKTQIKPTSSSNQQRSLSVTRNEKVETAEVIDAEKPQKVQKAKKTSVRETKDGIQISEPDQLHE